MTWLWVVMATALVGLSGAVLWDIHGMIRQGDP